MTREYVAERDGDRYWAHFIEVDRRSYQARVHDDTPETAELVELGETADPEFEADVAAIADYLYRVARVRTVVTLGPSGALLLSVRE